MSLVFRTLLISLILLVLAVPAGSVFGQAAEDVSRRQAELRQELEELEEEIEEQRSVLHEKQRETSSLERDVAVFNAQIRQAELSVRARNLRIQELEQEIAAKDDRLVSLTEEMEREKESLAQLLRKTRSLDEYSLIEILLSNRNLSDFFRDFESFAAIKQSLNNSFEEIAATKRRTRREQDILADKRAEQEELRQIQELQKRELEQAKAEKRALLEQTRGQEERYREIVQAREKSAAEIRSELFALRGSDAIPFEEALAHANAASAKTGVRPALILAVIEQESRLGENVGQCTYNQIVQGKPVMNPVRDVPNFVDITSRLGLDPQSQPVSCVWIRNGSRYGWGGAMGPAQFIPSTWAIYEDQLASVLNVGTANPWEPRHAFMASALLLSDNGADRGTAHAEQLAALRYFAGWRRSISDYDPGVRYYGTKVMERAAKHQKNIDTLGGS